MVCFGISDTGVDSWDDVIESVIVKAKGASSDQAPQGLSEARETLRELSAALSEGRYDQAVKRTVAPYSN